MEPLASSHAGNNIHLDSLETLSKDPSIEKLERGVASGLNLLGLIDSALGRAKNNSEVSTWMRKIQELRCQPKTRRTVVGVIGSTGAGKSSVINAILDEEDVAPTNCVRACTSVATEISYNASANDNERYRAKIEFITQEDWKKELDVLLHDLEDNPRADATDNSEAGNALAKIQSVFPAFTKQDILNLNVDNHKLSDDPTTIEILGTVKEISAPSPEQFAGLIKKYVDSKEKLGAQRNREDGPVSMELWPLIKVVRIFLQSPILKDGLVLVDLPGVHDSNKARSEVSKKYMKKCNAFWVLSPITRAVDDKAAENLMGESFKRQLQLDGAYNNVTFICSKTDDLSLTEAARNLHPEGEAELRNQIGDLKGRIKETDRNHNAKRKNLNVMADKMRGLGQDIAALKGALKNSGGKSYISVASPDTRKRKRPSTASPSARKTKPRIDDDSEYQDSNSDSDSDSDSDTDSAAEEPQLRLSRDDATDKLEELKASKKSLRAEKKSLTKEVKTIRDNVKSLKNEHATKKAELEYLYIKARNKYSRPAIKRQFAHGLHQLDADLDAELEEGDEEEIGGPNGRDYDETGRFINDKEIPAFRDVADTEIPALQQHALASTGAARGNSCRKILADLDRLLRGLLVQIVIADKPLAIAGNMKQEELAHLDLIMSKVQNSYDDLIKETIAKCRDILKANVLKRLPRAVRKSSEAAKKIIEDWGDSKLEKGMAWNTYRATCVRGGIFPKKEGGQDFNGDLAKPFIHCALAKYDGVFETQLPEQITKFVTDAQKCLEDFDKAMRKRQRLQAASSTHQALGKIKGFKQLLQDTEPLLKVLDDGRKEAHRKVEPTVAEFMKEAYNTCLKETGKGCYARMKQDMQDFFERVQTTMYKKAAEKVESRLEFMMMVLEEHLGDEIEVILTSMKNDLRQVIEGTNLFKSLKKVKKEIADLLSTADARFADILQGPDDRARTVVHINIKSDPQEPEREPQQEPQIKSELFI